MCGISGIFGHSEAANLGCLTLHALQHRGQESAGLTSSDRTKLYLFKRRGRVADIFEDYNFSLLLPGSSAVGHVRYSTTPEKNSAEPNAQPFLFDTKFGPVALVHNGNLVNYQEKRTELEQAGAVFSSVSDSEILLHLIARSAKPNFDQALLESLPCLEGAYCFLLLRPDALYVIRDPHGFRPLVLGRKDGAIIAVSETCALDLIQARYEREVEPGEVLKISDSGITILEQMPRPHDFSQCAFEHVYFSRPDSLVFGRNVAKTRILLGRFLAQEAPVEADCVVPVPDSGVYAAQGYAAQSGIPLSFAIVRNHYVGRTFIEPQQRIRDFGVRLKLNIIREFVEGKRIVLVDDSIVRSTTMKKIIGILRSLGVIEVHVRISCPPIKSPCYFGIDTRTRGELIASRKEVPEICIEIGADSLAYLSLKGMMSALCHFSSVNSDIRQGDGVFCSACWTCEYPVAIPGNPWLSMNFSI